MMSEPLDLDKGPLHVSMKEPYARLDKIKNRKGKLVERRICGNDIDEIRKMKLIDIEMDKKFKKAYVDLITGSLYDFVTGICLSSPNLYIAKARE
jgi:hypothetical protein